MADFNTRLRELLVEHDLTVPQLSRRYEERFGEELPQNTISGWLNKGVAPSPGRLLNLSRLFDVAPYWLWGDDRRRKVRNEPPSSKRSNRRSS